MNDPRQFYAVRMDAEMERGVPDAFERYLKAAELAVRPSEEWPRTPPRNATLEEMGWTLIDLGRAASRDERMWQARKGGWRIHHSVSEEFHQRAHGANIDIEGLVRRSLTHEVRKWESL